MTNEQEAFSAGSVNQYNSYEEEEIDQEFVDHLASQGDSDALNVVSFERDLEEMFQEVPDLHNALLSYQEARTKILERKRSRGFWPATGKGKSKGAGKFHQFRKGSGKGSLFAAHLKDIFVEHAERKVTGKQSARTSLLQRRIKQTS